MTLAREVLTLLEDKTPQAPTGSIIKHNGIEYKKEFASGLTAVGKDYMAVWVPQLDNELVKEVSEFDDGYPELEASYFAQRGQQ